jgi:GxxExxY protein
MEGVMDADERLADMINGLTEQIIGGAIAVHRELGPGLLESAYQTCLKHELECRGLNCRTEVELPVVYRGIALECGYRIDLLINELVVVELKTVEAILPVHEAQLLTYLKLARCPAGLLINFFVPKLTDGLKRLVNNFPNTPPPSASPRLGG